MKLIVGLGNPGEKYKNNRHNVGCMVVDELLKKTNLLSDLVIKKSGVFMNNSGQAVNNLLSKYPSVSLADLYIVHDDLDIKMGEYKIQKGKGPKDHKGLKSIDEALGTNDYWHVRIGVDNRSPEERISGEEYVLQDFTEAERPILGKVIDETCKKLAIILKNTN